MSSYTDIVSGTSGNRIEHLAKKVSLDTSIVSIYSYNINTHIQALQVSFKAIRFSLHIGDTSWQKQMHS